MFQISRPRPQPIYPPVFSISLVSSPASPLRLIPHLLCTKASLNGHLVLGEDLSKVDNLVLLGSGAANTLANGHAGEGDGDGTLAAADALGQALAPVARLGCC